MLLVLTKDFVNLENPLIVLIIDNHPKNDLNW